MDKDKVKPVKSTMLQGYSYDAQSLVLTVIFKNGTERTYKNIAPPLMSQVFDRPGSIGSKFKRLIGSKANE